MVVSMFLIALGETSGTSSRETPSSSESVHLGNACNMIVPICWPWIPKPLGPWLVECGDSPNLFFKDHLCGTCGWHFVNRCQRVTFVGWTCNCHIIHPMMFMNPDPRMWRVLILWSYFTYIYIYTYISIWFHHISSRNVHQSTMVSVFGEPIGSWFAWGRSSSWPRPFCVV